MKRLRVLYLTGSLNLGGTERNILHLATRLDPERFEPAVWSDYPGQPLEKELRARGVPVGALKAGPSIGKLWPVRLARHNLPYQRRMLRLLREYRDGVVHAMGFPMAYYAVLLGRLAGCRRIVFAVQDWDVWKRSPVYGALDRLCSRLAWRIVADGEGARREAIRRQGMSAERCMTIYDGVDVAELQSRRDPADVRRELGLDPARPVVGMIARLDIAKKAQDTFLDAVPLIARGSPKAQFLLVGDGPDRATVEARVQALPEAMRPVMAGSRLDLADILCALDILVIPSRWESVPKVLLEALWLDRAVVAARVGDIPEILDASCGVLVEPDRPPLLAKAVVGLLNDPVQAQRLGLAGHHRLLERGLTLDASIRRYEELYLSGL